MDGSYGFNYLHAGKIIIFFVVTADILIYFSFFLEKFFQEYHQSSKQFLSRSGSTLCLILVRMPGHVAQSVTCLATDACLTADPGVASSIPVRSHTFVEIDHEMISTVILLLPLIHSRRVVVSYKRKYVHKLLVNRLFKPAQEKVWLGELTVPK